MLIIEGADSLGKTTAAKRIVELAGERLDPLVYPIHYRHMGRPDKSFNFSTDYLPLMFRFAVQDRFHWGSLVWHKDVMDKFTLKWLDARLTLQGTYTVLIVSGDENWYYEKLCGELNSRNQKFSVDKLVKANKRYRDLLLYEQIINPDETWTINGHKDYLDDNKLIRILNRWVERLQKVRNLECERTYL